MKVLIGDLELQGTGLEILKDLRTHSWYPDMTLDEYYDFMCANHRR